MEFFDAIIRFITQPDEIISDLIKKYNNWIYIFLFLIVFAETGLIVMSFLMPFLPGDALIFAVGMIAAKGELEYSIIIPLLIFAALLGDNVNYLVGRRFGSFIMDSEKSYWIKKSHIQKASDFFEKNGKKSIIIARFIPVIRTIVPFLCGTTKVSYRTFLLYSVIGALLWVGMIGTLGYFLGQFAFVKEHLGKFILLIIVLANLPLIKQIIHGRKKSS